MSIGGVLSSGGGGNGGGSRKVLFNNSSNGSANIALSDSAANFDALMICYKTNEGINGSTYLESPDGQLVGLFGAYSNKTGMWFKSVTYRVSGTSMTVTKQGGTWFDTGETAAGSATVNYDYKIHITKVIGIKY